jgi:hypothetical protein
VEGLSFTREQLRQEFKVDGDIADLVSGTLTPEALRLTANTLALMRYRPGTGRATRNIKSTFEGKSAKTSKNMDAA